jgi:hypothetical protein
MNIEPERSAIHAPSHGRFGMITPISDLEVLCKLMYLRGLRRYPEF